MQVKKFEAKTIKEAIELVKRELGPEAIILGAKENVRSFGLMGETSVEVTAAITDTKLRQKQLAERKMNAKTRETYNQSPARTQRQFIDGSSADDNFDMMTQRAAAATVTAPMIKRSGPTSMRYIDIDEDGQASKSSVVTVSQGIPDAVAAARIQTAIKSSVAANDHFSALPTMLPSKRKTTAEDSAQVMALKSEIDNLKGMLERFQKVPQNFISMHPGAEEGIPFEFSSVFKKLKDAGLAIPHIVEALRQAADTLPPEHKAKRAFVEGWVIRYMLDQIDVVEKPMAGRIHMFLGPTGQGKSSTVVKIAAHLALKEKKKVAVLSGDVFKVGAKDSMKIYCQIMNIPFGVVQNANDWRNYEHLLKNMDYILIDSAGTNLKKGEELDRIRQITPMTNEKIRTHFVQSALARDADAFEIADRFRIIGFDDVIFTRLDETVQQGLIYNFHKRYEVPMHSFGIGSHIPEDFEFASKERVVDMIFSLSKLFKDKEKERGQS